MSHVSQPLAAHPAGPPLATWVTDVSPAVVVVGGTESKGFHPSVTRWSLIVRFSHVFEAWAYIDRVAEPIVVLS